MISHIIGPNGQQQSKPIVISSLGIRKTILMLHKNVKRVKYVHWYGVTSFMPGLRKL